MIFVSLLIAMTTMTLATLIERRLGPSAAIWVATMPIAFATSALAVCLDKGALSTQEMALSAAAQICAQVVFAVVFSAALLRRGVFVSTVVAAAAYTASTVGLHTVPAAIAIIAGITLLTLAPHVMNAGSQGISSPHGRFTQVLTTLVAISVVGLTITCAQLGGPSLAGALGAFPTMSTMLIIAFVRANGPEAGAQALVGLIRGLPCYLTFCLALALTAQLLGPAAIAVGLLVALAAARITWQTIPTLGTSAAG